MRRALALSIAAGLGVATWLRSEPARPVPAAGLDLVPLSLPAGCCAAGPFRLVGAWQLRSANGAFGGYSALLGNPDGSLTAFSDRGFFVNFGRPGAAPVAARFGATQPTGALLRDNRDVEAATSDPATGQVWLAQEARNAVTRYGPGLDRQAFREIPEWRGWGGNNGPEAFIRLRDGRFVTLCECRTSWRSDDLHPASLQLGDPTDNIAAQTFTFAGASGFRPTDMAQLPDGRVIILERRLTWPIPARFAIRLLIADPAAIRPGAVWKADELAALDVPWPVDNYEGLMIERTADGKLAAWLISDENKAVTQRALLLKLTIDEAALPAKQKAPGPAGRP